MPALKVLRLQATAQALFEATDAQAPAERFHASGFAHGLANGVDLGLIVDCDLNALTAAPLSLRFRRFNGLFHFDTVKHAGGRVDAAIDTVPTFGL